MTVIDFFILMISVIAVSALLYAAVKANVNRKVNVHHEHAACLGGVGYDAFSWVNKDRFVNVGGKLICRYEIASSDIVSTSTISEAGCISFNTMIRIRFKNGTVTTLFGRDAEVFIGSVAYFNLYGFGVDEYRSAMFKMGTLSSGGEL